MSKELKILRGAIDSLPLIFAAVPFGLIFGALAVSIGLSSWATMSMSLFVFAGASQFIAISLISSGAPLLLIYMAVFFVNLRHLLYSVTLMPYVANLPQKLRIPMAFCLTDETFAVVSKKILKKQDESGIHLYYFGSALTMYTVWSLCTFIGIVLGQQIPDMISWGLDVAMILSFVGIVVPNLKDLPDWACAITAMISTILTYDWPNQIGLFFSSILAISIAVFLEKQS